MKLAVTRVARCSLYLAACVIVAISASAFRAQPQSGQRSDKKPPDQLDPQQTSQRPIPSQTPIDQITMPDGRVIQIEKGIAGNTKFLYFHRPLFAFIERPPGQQDSAVLRGQPSIIRDIRPGSSGEAVVMFTVASSTSEFCQLCNHHLFETLQDQVARGMPIEHALDAAKVMRYPLLHVLVQCRNGDEVLGRGETDRLDDRGDQFDFSITMSKDALQRFSELHKDGKVRFHFTYLYEGVTAGQAISYVTAQKSIRENVQRELSSEKIAPGTPITQGEYNAIRQRIGETFRRTLIATDLKAAELLQGKNLDTVVSALFSREPIDLDKIENLGARDQGTRDKLNSHLQALEQTERFKKYTFDEWRKLREAKRKEENTARLTSVGLSIPTKAGVLGINLGGDLGGKTEEEWRNEIEQKYGFQTTFDRETKTFEAHKINIYRLAQAWQDFTFGAVDSVFLQTGVKASYAESSPVVSTFVLDQVKAAEQQNPLPTPNNSIRLGMVIPFFGSGEKAPPGYVWADGKEMWPIADWVPKHLQGKPVPNLNGRVVRGAGAFEEIGESGGSDQVAAHATKPDGSHRHRVPDHSHPLPATTGPISDEPNNPIVGVRYTIKDDNAGWRRNDGGGAHHIEVGGGNNEEGQHRHNLGGRTIGSGVLTTVEGDGAHSHAIDAIPFVPSFVGVRYLIRMK